MRQYASLIRSHRPSSATTLIPLGERSNAERKTSSDTPADSAGEPVSAIPEAVDNHPERESPPIGSDRSPEASPNDRAWRDPPLELIASTPTLGDSNRSGRTISFDLTARPGHCCALREKSRGIVYIGSVSRELYFHSIHRLESD